MYPDNIYSTVQVRCSSRPSHSVTL